MTEAELKAEAKKKFEHKFCYDESVGFSGGGGRGEPIYEKKIRTNIDQTKSILEHINFFIERAYEEGGKEERKEILSEYILMDKKFS